LPYSNQLLPDSCGTFLEKRYSCYGRLKCRDGGLAFGVEVIKHEHTDLGAVLLYLNNQHLVVAAYTVDNDQLPRSNQVAENTALTAARLTMSYDRFQQ